MTSARWMIEVERPITYSARSVREIRARNKTQTRRVAARRETIGWVGWPCDSDPGVPERVCSEPSSGAFHWHDPDGFHHGELRCPHGKVGDGLWVRETWALDSRFDGFRPSQVTDLLRATPAHVDLFYRADGDEAPAGRALRGFRTCAPSGTLTRGRWRSPRFMSGSFSRLVLVIRRVRLEPLH